MANAERRMMDEKAVVFLFIIRRSAFAISLL